MLTGISTGLADRKLLALWSIF